MKLMVDEKNLLQTANDELILTNFRVMKFVKLRGLINYSSISLDKISSIHFHSIEFKPLLYIGFAVFVIGLIGLAGSDSNKVGILMFSCIIAGIFFLLYYLTRRQILEICGEGSERIKTITGTNAETALKFIHAVENMIKEGKLPTDSPINKTA